MDSCNGGVVLACVFYSLPTKVPSGGFAVGRMYERGLILWIREQSEYCQDLNYNNGGGGATPKDVATCGGSVWRGCGEEGWVRWWGVVVCVVQA